MKKFTLLLSTLFFGIGAIAQPITLPQRKLTDLDAKVHDLHSDYLQNGKYLCLFFFFCSSEASNSVAQSLDQAYAYFGDNQQDVIFMAVNKGDTERNVRAFAWQHKLEMPIISGNIGQGSFLVNSLEIEAFPTVVLVSPDGKIVENDLWPLESSSQIVRSIEAHLRLDSNQAFLLELGFGESSAEFHGQTLEVQLNCEIDQSRVEPTFELSEGAYALWNGLRINSGSSLIDLNEGERVFSVVSENGQVVTDYYLVVKADAAAVSQAGSEPSGLFPNPVSDVLTITNSEGAVAYVYDIQGRMIDHIETLTQNHPYDVSGLAAGDYVVLLVKPNGSEFIRFSVLH